MSWNPRRWVSRPATPHLDRTADVIGCFMNGLGLLWGIGATGFQWFHHQLTPRDGVIVATLLPLTAITTGWIATAVVRRRSARVPLVVHTAVCFLSVLVFLGFWEASPGQFLSPMTFAVELGAAAAWTCLTWPVAVVDQLFTVSLGGVVMARTGAVGQTEAVVLNIGNSAYYGAIGLVATMAWTAIVSAVQMAQRASDSSAAAVSQLVTAQEAAAASSRWDGVIHDHVLNALATVAHPGLVCEQAARTLSRQALDALSQDQIHPPARGLSARLVDAARLRGLDADIGITGEPPSSIVGVLGRAAEEALTNISRHAGTASVRVTGRFTPEHAELVIRDDGCGFDPDRVPETRHGLRGSIVSAMEVRGGRARIDSARGRGTTITLLWDDPRTEPVHLARFWSFRAMVVFLAQALAISLFLGWFVSEDVIETRVQIGLTVVLIGLVIAAFCWRPLSRNAKVVITVLTVCCQVAMLGNLHTGTVQSWQEWFIGFGLGVFAPLAWRTMRRSWAVVVVASWPVVTVVGTLINGANPFWVMLSRGSSYTWPLTLTIAAAWAGRSMRSSLREIAHSHQATLDTLRRRARADATRHETERRLATIKGAPMEMLDYLACGGAITGSVKQQCSLLEASTRDLLVAPFILDHTMQAQFQRARRRGARVTITGGEAIEDASLDAAQAFRRACAILAEVAGAGQRLTCRWHPGAEGDAATVALVSENGATVGDGVDSTGEQGGQSWRQTVLARLRDATGRSTPGTAGTVGMAGTPGIEIIDADGDLLVLIGAA